MPPSTSNESQRILNIDFEQNGHIIASLRVNHKATVGNYFNFIV